ncbi:MAG TPA: hypothetical protein ACFE0H_12440 [Elainellaceae cyanobacterium]
MAIQDIGMRGIRTLGEGWEFSVFKHGLPAIALFQKPLLNQDLVL